MAIGLASAATAAPPVSQREWLGATLWVQRAEEYRLVARQTFAAATARLRDVLAPGTASLDQERRGRFADLPPAVVLDVDETVLDNSDFQGWELRTGQPYSRSSWSAWVLQARARGVPGALEFTRAAADLGIAVFYVTNRECRSPEDCPEKTATLRNLKALGFPGAEAGTVLLRNERAEWADGDKSRRRAVVAERHRIVMLVGDDLQDFLSADETRRLRSDPEGALAGSVAAQVGRRWFLLPNPLYGSWERALPPTLAGRYESLSAASLPVAPPRALRLVAWNLEWLMAPSTYDALRPDCLTTGQPRSDVRSFPCTPDRPHPPRRVAGDFDTLAAYARRLDADVVALSEVDGPEAAALVFREGYALDCFSRRQHPQKTGFAIRRGIPYRCHPEVAELDVDGAQRTGADMTIHPDTPDAVRLLSVHLASGCFHERLDSATNAACAKLRRQVVVLETWVDARAAEGSAFALLGDFNRRLELDARYGPGTDAQAPLNLFWALSDGLPAGAGLRRATEGQAYVPCSRADGFDAYIDNVLVSATLLARADKVDFVRLPYRDDDVIDHQLSDHCPLGMTLEGAIRTAP